MNADADAQPDDGRDESKAERLDRNWAEMLQELRVVQTGTQILTGFLLTLVFQQRFTDLEPYQVEIYLILVALSALATILALTPVSLHRALFRQRAKPQIVRFTNVILELTLVVVGLTLTGTTLLVFDVVAGHRRRPHRRRGHPGARRGWPGSCAAPPLVKPCVR